MLAISSQLVYSSICCGEKLQRRGSLVKWLRRRPLTAESGVRLPYELGRYSFVVFESGYPLSTFVLGNTFELLRKASPVQRILQVSIERDVTAIV